MGGAPAIKYPCPAHNTFWCQSRLTTSEVTLIETPSIWFQNTLQANYNDPAWNFNYVGGNNNLKGTFFVDRYLAYNECNSSHTGFLGAELVVDFNAAADSLIKDVLWIQTVYFTPPNIATSAVDDRNLLAALGGNPAGSMYGPFYPFQDEDEDPPLWQTSYQACDYLGDKPGYICPAPGTSKSMYFETYAVWWDDYFQADGSIVDVGNDGHNVFVHEGFYWSYEVSCAPIPAPGAMLLASVGVSICGWLRRRRTL